MNYIPRNNLIPGSVSRIFTMAGAPVTGTAEVQTLTNSAASGQYRLDYGGAVTASLAFNAAAAAIQTALQALANIKSGNVTVAGTLPTITITFAGVLATGPQPLIRVVNSTLNVAASVARTTAGVAPTLQGAPKGAMATRADTGAIMSNTGTPTAPVWTAVT